MLSWFFCASVFFAHFKSFKRKETRQFLKSSFQAYSKIEKVQRISHILLAPLMHSLPHCRHHPPEWGICYSGWICIDTSLITQRLQLHQSSFLVQQICVSGHISHHYGILHNIFTALKILSTQTCSVPSSPTPGNQLSFYCLHSLPFPECPIVGVAQDVASSDWLLSLSNTDLSFYYDISWFDSSFLFSAK